jgi:hypothetical protein
MPKPRRRLAARLLFASIGSFWLRPCAFDVHGIAFPEGNPGTSQP